MGQLHAQNHEDDAVQHELERFPHAFGLQLRAGRGRRVPLGQKRHGEPRRHHGDDGADVHRLGREVDDEGNEQLQHHVERRVVQPEAADEREQGPGRRAHDRAADKAAEQIEGELLAGVHERERTRGHDGHAAGEQHRARHVVEQGLAPQQRLMAAAELAVLRERHDRHRIGGPQGRPQREAGGQRDGRRQAVQGGPAGGRDGEHEAHGQRGDAPPVAPEAARVHMARLVEVQRRDEQDEQQLRVDAPFQRRRHRQRDDGPQRDLHEGQRHPRQELLQNAGGDDGDEQEQDELEGLHGDGAPHRFGKFRSTLTEERTAAALPSAARPEAPRDRGREAVAGREGRGGTLRPACGRTAGRRPREGRRVG